MSREIRFRGKRADNGNWVYGGYCKYEKLFNDGFDHFIIEETLDGESFRVLHETVGQYVGLLDKNNKPIYEGDIVKCVYNGDVNTYIVVWDQAELDFKVTNSKEEYGKNFKYLPCCADIEITGNIYDDILA